MRTKKTSEAQSLPDPSSTASPADPASQAVLPGAFGIMKSPLFYAVTVIVVCACVAFSIMSREYLLGVLAGLALELLLVVLIWQYLLLSSRLENMAHRIADLYRQGEVIGADVQGSRPAHGYTHRLLTEISSDQSRSLQSAEEFRKAFSLFYEQLQRMTEEIHSHQVEIATTQDVRARLSALEAELQKRTDQSELKKSLATLEAEFSKFAARESAIKQSLEVSTAIDRLNLEVRKQLAKMRQEVGID